MYEEFLENNDSELLNLLVDGEIEPEMESQVFASLAGNDSLRCEFRELMAIRETVRRDTEAFTPPAEATKNLFDQLGFVPPIAAVNVASTASVAGKSMMSVLMKKILIPLITAVVSTGITAVVLNNYYADREKAIRSSIPKITASAEKTITSPVQALNNSAVAFNNNASVQKPMNPSSGNHRFASSPQSVFASNGSSNVTLRKEEAAQYASAFSNFGMIDRTDDVNYSGLENGVGRGNSNDGITSVKPVGSFRLTAFLHSSESFDRNWTISFRGIASQSYPASNLPSQADPMFKNMSIGGFYRINNNIRVGAEFGQEAFTQTFNGFDNGNAVKYIQNPMLFWSTASVIIETDKMNSLFGTQFFIQQNIGGTIAGGLTKSVIGIEYMTDSGLEASFGAEGTFLFYKNDNSWYSSKKLGFTYGIFLLF